MIVQEAYTYQVINSRNSYFVYTDKTLLGSLEKKSRIGQPVSLEIKNHHYELNTAGIINPLISVTNTTTNELIGTIKISSFGRLFPKVIFNYNGITLKWVSKSIFALHWQWQKNKMAVVETIENFQIGKQKGIIVLSDYFADADLLIMVGVYLRNNVRTLPFNILGNSIKPKKAYLDSN